MSGIINKVKDALHSDQSSTGTTGTAEGVAGPHSTRAGNAADPRIDSDLDGHAAHHGVTSTGVTGAHNHGVTGTGHTGTYGSTNAGPHSTNVANKLDPRVDATTGTTATFGTGYGNTSTTGTGVGNHPLGGTGDAGGLSHSTNAGPHNSNAANKLDPRVDSDLDSTGNRHGASKAGVFGASGSHATAGSGTAQNTNGPHNSDFLNKADPRVDADGDGSKTFGGNRTHAAKDPSDAAQVPPSVMRDHIGAPTVLHNDPHAKHAERHGSRSGSHQEQNI